jgi:hypothetical protein
MTKRIPCRVVRSVPLGNGGGTAPHRSGLNAKHENINDAVAGDVRAGDAGASVACVGWSGITSAPIDDSRGERVLDCYV